MHLDPLTIARRSFLRQNTYGLGGIALAMLGPEALAAAAKPACRSPQTGAAPFRLLTCR